MYDRDALLRGIEDIRKNIGVFEQAIEAEWARIKEYYRIIDELDRKEREKAAAIVKEVTRDDDPQRRDS